MHPCLRHDSLVDYRPGASTLSTVGVSTSIGVAADPRLAAAAPAAEAAAAAAVEERDTRPARDAVAGVPAPVALPPPVGRVPDLPVVLAGFLELVREEAARGCLQAADRRKTFGVDPSAAKQTNFDDSGLRETNEKSEPSKHQSYLCAEDASGGDLGNMLRFPTPVNLPRPSSVGAEDFAPAT